MSLVGHRREGRQRSQRSTQPGTSTKQTKATGEKLESVQSPPGSADMFSLLLPTNSMLVAALGMLLTRLPCSSLSVPDIPHIAAFFGTKTRYEEVNPHLLRDVSSVNTSFLKLAPTDRCSPVHLTAVIRHGSRYPTVKNVRRIQKLSDLVRRESSRGSAGAGRWLQDIQSRWEMWYTEDMDGRKPLKFT